MNKKENNYIACNDFEFIMREIWVRLNKSKILNYLKNNSSKNSDYNLIIDFVKERGISLFPYEYIYKYKTDDITVKKDDKCNLLYILTKSGKKLYLKKKYRNYYRAKRYYNNILIEQDIDSPHRYISDGYEPDAETIILDIGGAEGFFSLEYVDKVKKIYIFECDEYWIEALKQTYKNYEDKVIIINKYVSDKDDDKHISLDSFISEYNLNSEKILVKIDAESSELSILDGGKQYINMANKSIFLVCAYHKNSDEEEIRKRMTNYKIETSKGYMLYYYDYQICEPYYRRGILRCKKN